MAKKEPYVIRSGGEIIMFHATPHEAARKVVRETRGTYDRKKFFHEQPEGAHEARPATLSDVHDRVLMSCRPSVRGRFKTSSTFANCHIKPEFKRRLRKRRRR